MKAIKIIFILLLLLWYFQRSLAGDPEWLTRLPAPQMGIKVATPPALMAPPRNPDFCKQYKRQEISGWVLLGVGAGSLAGGSYLIYKGVTDVLNNNSTIHVNDAGSTGPNISKRDITYIGVGSAMGLVGLVLTPTGLGMGISGTIRYHKYCGGRSSYLIKPAIDNYGLGLAATF
jgi:hypothetical protein